MNTNVSTEKNRIDGVECGVKNCQFHDKAKNCTARSITVGPGYAKTSSETACVTFIPDSASRG